MLYVQADKTTNILTIYLFIYLLSFFVVLMRQINMLNDEMLKIAKR